MRKRLVQIFFVMLLLAGSAYAWTRLHLPTTEASEEAGEEDEYVAPISKEVPASATETAATPANRSALGGYDVLIADRGNNRLLEVTPDKRIIWEYDFDLPRPGLGADDAFFTDHGNSIIAGLEEWQTIQLIDYTTKKVVWQYGRPGRYGAKDGELHTPDDPYMLPNGDVTVADISNCRILEISPDKKIVRQYGVTGRCGQKPGLLDKPNGDTPLPGGHMFVSDIIGHTLIELDQDWRPVLSMTLPLKYPSDPQLTKAGTILVASYTDPGKIIELRKNGTVVWEQAFTAGERRLKRPSLAIELPNGNILANDDGNHRVIVIDKATHEIIWQYGVTGKPGRGPGQLNVPDGVDIILRPVSTDSPPKQEQPAMSIGSVTRHAAEFSGKLVRVTGYLLKNEGSYLIISDEPDGTLGRFDLPVTGMGISAIGQARPYIFTGSFTYGGLKAANGNPYHLALTEPPEAR